MIAARIAASIEVPSPKPVLIQIDEDFIAAAGGELADINPGLAFGTVWEEDSFPVARAVGALAQVSNPESVAGVTVLDSLLRNTDRHAENALSLNGEVEKGALKPSTRRPSLLTRATPAHYMPSTCGPSESDRGGSPAERTSIIRHPFLSAQFINGHLFTTPRRLK